MNDSIKVPCEHYAAQKDKIDVNTYKCMKQLKQKFQQCQHEVEYYCFEKDNFNDKCHFICDKLLPCGDRCKKKCYENCQPCINNCQTQNKLNLCEHFLESINILQEQPIKCNQEVKVLLDCGHTAIFKCWQREELQKSYVCKQTCNKNRICGHTSNRCQNYCFQQQCSPCMQKITIKLDCGHKYKIFCYQKDDYIKQSFQCLEKCTKKRLCQHDQPCNKYCYQECTPCRKIIEQELSCGHKVKLQCFNANQELQNYQCTQPCNKKRPCGHLDPCLKQCGDHTCTPCEKIVNKQFKCAHNVIEICSNLRNYQCKQICTRPQQCEHPCLKQCWEACGPCQQKISKVYASCAHVVEIVCSEKESLIHNQCQECAGKNQCLVQ